MNSAKQMWDYILATHQLDSPEEQAQVRDALATSGSRKILRQRRWRYILNDSTLFYCAQGPQASRSMRRKGLNDSWQHCQKLSPCCDFNSDWQIRSGRHGLKLQSNTT